MSLFSCCLYEQSLVHPFHASLALLTPATAPVILPISDALSHRVTWLRSATEHTALFVDILNLDPRFETYSTLCAVERVRVHTHTYGVIITEITFCTITLFHIATGEKLSFLFPIDSLRQFRVNSDNGMPFPIHVDVPFV